MPRSDTEGARAAPDRRRLPAILAQPRWQGIDGTAVEALLARGELTTAAIRDLDHCLAYAEDELAAGGRADAQMFLAFNGDRKYARKLYSARKALMLIFERHPLVGEIALAASELNRRSRASRPQRASARPLLFSVAEADLPAPWRDALGEMRRQLAGFDIAAPAPSTVSGVAMAMRRLGKSATEAGLPVALSRDALVAHERTLAFRDPPLAPATIFISLGHIRHFARYVGADPAIVAHLDQRVRLHRSRTRRAVSRTQDRILKVPSYAAVFALALDLLAAAERATNPVVAQRCRSYAAAIALLCPFPLRVSDSALVFGDDVTWTGENYFLSLTATSKNQQPFHAPIAPFFQIFIDQLVLQGRPIEELEELRQRCIDTRRALFVDRHDQPYRIGYVSYVWWKVFGTGSHVARTKIHDEFAVFGVAGIEGAMRACTHRTDSSTEFYRSLAFTRLSGEHVHRALEQDVSMSEWEAYFS